MHQHPSTQAQLLAVETDDALRQVLSSFPNLTMAIVFGSVAWGNPRRKSDLDIAVQAPHALAPSDKMAIIMALATQTGRPIDLVDLCAVPDMLRAQIIRHGRRLFGSDEAYARLLSRHLVEQADFLPYRNRVLAERRLTWTGK